MHEGMKIEEGGRKFIAVYKDDRTEDYQCAQGCAFDCASGGEYGVLDCPSEEETGILHCDRNHNLIWKEYQEVKSEDAQSISGGEILYDPMISAEGGKKYDNGKNRYDLIPPDALDMVVSVLTAGAEKYNEAFDEENWRKVDHKERRYFGAAMRHMWAVRRGEHYDKETGLHHYAHAASNLMFLLQTELENKEKEYE